MPNLTALKDEFTRRYGLSPRVFRAPGRVNLIGEHTDYNEGFVLPAAIEFAAYVAAAPRDDRMIRAASLDYDGELSLSLDEERSPERSWTKYVQGVAVTLERNDIDLSGADLLITSDVPTGAGLSSSAALSTALGYALCSVSEQLIDRELLARVGQQTEHNFAGVRTGIMDQFVSANGVRDHALFLDCRDLSWSPIPLGGATFVVCNTKTTHDLAESEYNKRRHECEQAAGILGKHSLRDVGLDELLDRRSSLDDLLFRRARHVVTENDRVVRSVSALRAGDLNTFGDLVNRSHDSLRDDYEVSSRELDLMVELARQQPNLLGARMMGGGFGGCTINVLEPGDQSEFKTQMSEGYERETGKKPDVYEFEIGDGASEVSAA